MLGIISQALGQSFLACVFGVLLSIILYWTSTKQQRKAMLSYLLSQIVSATTRGRLTSTAKTPPRSVSPEDAAPSDRLHPGELKDTFPPSRRVALVKLSSESAMTAKPGFHGGDLDDLQFKDGLIPFDADYRQCARATYTPTGFSVDEIKALGDFPDYAELSGVRLPEAYDGFKIETALPRPYRPFRWAYHQTMCISPFLEPFRSPLFGT